MTEVILSHHAQGLTDGVRAFADELRAAGHVVHTPDLYDGHTCAELADGMGDSRARSARRRNAADAGALPPNEDLEAARELEVTVDHAQLYLYPGDRHLVTDRTLAAYDEGAAAPVTQRMLGFLDGIG